MKHLIIKIICVLILSVLFIGAFMQRLENYQNFEVRSIDEVVYFRLAKKLRIISPNIILLSTVIILKPRGGN